MAAWRASGKSVTAFAKERGLPSSSMYQWINPPKTRRRGQAGKRRKPVSKAAFAEVAVVDSVAVSSPVLTVALRGGHSVSFEGGAVDPSWLAAVLKVVSAC